MVKRFSEAQMEKNGVTPNAMLSTVMEHINNGGIRALAITFIDKSGEAQVLTWCDTEDELLNQLALVGACNTLARFANDSQIDEI